MLCAVERADERRHAVERRVEALDRLVGFVKLLLNGAHSCARQIGESHILDV